MLYWYTGIYMQGQGCVTGPRVAPSDVGVDHARVGL
jgi:hypothetical protein